MKVFVQQSLMLVLGTVTAMVTVVTALERVLERYVLWRVSHHPRS